jgi:hypothetical protein
MSMSLAEFLATADADHAIALQQARDYAPQPYLWRIEGPVRKTQVETAAIINDTLARLAALIADDQQSPVVVSLAKKILRAFDRLYNPEFYISLADPEVKALFDAAVAYGVLNTDESMRIAAAATYQDPKPFTSTTLHHVLTVRNACPTQPIEAIAGQYFVIETSAECERHSPALWGQNPRTLRWMPINRFPVIDSVGRYELAAPVGDYAAFKVDDAYGVITCLKTL